MCGFLKAFSIDLSNFHLFQLLQHLHSENNLSKRFPIGLEEQIKKWDSDKIRKFHERWYFPANATLYLVGDINYIPKAVQQIEVCTTFEHSLYIVQVLLCMMFLEI